MVLGPDLGAVAWAFAHLPDASLARVGASRGVDERTRAMIANRLAATA